MTHPDPPPPADDAVRPELAELRARLAATTDAARPDAVARRRKAGLRTVRENIADLVDPGSLVEYGALALAAQRQRHALDDLVRLSPADGLVCGVGTVNRALFDEERARAMVLGYDYTVRGRPPGGPPPTRRRSGPRCPTGAGAPTRSAPSSRRSPTPARFSSCGASSGAAS